MRQAPSASLRAIVGFIAVSTVVVSLAGCSKDDKPAPSTAPIAVTALTVTTQDVPVSTEYVAQTQSSQAVNIQARVSGFLDKRVYTEGAVVKAGQVLFQMDQKPFQAQVDAQKAAMQRNEASLQVATANLARTKPLAEQNALSQKDLDDAQGQYEQAAAAVAQAKAQLEEAQLNLSYTTIASPVTGVSSFAAVADGTYLNPQNAQLTTVSVLTPMWINFSLSENQMERLRNEVRAGLLKLPPNMSFVVEIELIDGTLFPYTGHITFADPSYNSQTGTFLIRASVDNPQGLLRPNQYVRTRLKGAVRPNAILVPQRAVQQSAKGHFVWVINKQEQAELRPVVVGDWYQDSWFIAQGLATGERVVVDGAIRLAQGVPVKATAYVPPKATAAPAPGSNLSPGTTAPAAAVVHFASGTAMLDAEAKKVIATAAKSLAGLASTVLVTGYTDKTGATSSNVELAKQRALAVRDALIKAGVAAEAIQLQPPAQVTGSGSDADARHVDIAILR